MKSAELRHRCETLERFNSLLLDGIRLHAVPGEAEALAAFQSTISQHQRQLEGAAAENLLVIAGAILQSMHAYGQQTTAWHCSGQRELQTMVVMLAKALQQVLEGKDRGVDTLQALGRQVESVSELDDIRSIRGRLETCLATLQQEAKRQAAEQGSLRDVMQRVASSAAVARSFESQGDDPITGLANRAAAQAVLSEAFNAGREVYAVPLRLETLAIVNARYGRDAGDEYLLKVSQLIAQALSAGDQLFRWGGPALLAVIERQYGPEAVRAEIDRFTAKIREHTLTLGARFVLFRASLSSLCLRIPRFPDIDALLAQIDAFAFRNEDGNKP